MDEDRFESAIQRGKAKVTAAIDANAELEQGQLTRSEREAAAVYERVAALESRMNAIETRLDTPPAG